METSAKRASQNNPETQEQAKAPREPHLQAEEQQADSSRPQVETPLTATMDTASFTPEIRTPRFGPNFYKLLILVATAIWGFAFVVMKDTVADIPPALLIGLRFFFSFIVLALIFWRPLKASLNRRCLIQGAILGVLLFLAFWTQTIGLDHTTPGINAFLTATYCIIVPFGWWIIARKRPNIFNVLAACLCLIGINLVSITSADGGLHVGLGEFMTLICAVFFAIHIVFVSLFTQPPASGNTSSPIPPLLREPSDVYALTVLQFFFGGLCGLLIGIVFEGLPGTDVLSLSLLWNMVYLVLFASCAALLIQNVALAYVPPAQASLLLSTESVFGVLFSVLLFGEMLTPRLIAGFALIFAGILVSELLASRKQAWKDQKEDPR